MNTQSIPPFEQKAAGWCGDPRRGAQMGRGHADAGTLTGKVHLQRVRLDSGGYDKGGAYWGMPCDLWCAWDDNGEQDYTRAPTREAAKERIRAGHPRASFFR